MNSIAAAKLDLTINQDWTRTISMYSTMKEKWANGELRLDSRNDHWDTDYYNFGELGSLISLDNRTKESKQCCSLTGKIVEMQLPWIKKLKEDCKDLELVSIGIMGTTASISRHKDLHNAEVDAKGHCRIIYVINNSDTITYVENNNEVEHYTSTANTAWLLDTTKYHWVDKKSGPEEIRYVFQLTFYKSFNEVLKWFNDHPGMVYSNQ